MRLGPSLPGVAVLLSLDDPGLRVEGPETPGAR
jgi:hypothetical protein